MSMADIRIVPANRDMMKQVAQLERETFPDPWSAEDLSACLENPAYLILAAEDGGGEIRGYLIGILIPCEGEICRVAVPPEKRRQGIGRELLSEFMRYGARTGCDRYFLEVREGGEPARALYRSVGFEEYGRRKNYYRHPTEDAILMVLGKEPS